MTFEGEIRDIDLARTFLELAHGRFTGAARFENDDLIKIIYLREGQFLSASTNDRADTLDEILLRGSIASRDHIRQALARRKEGESLGDALLNLGFITRRELVKARRVQLVGILRSLQEWDAGTYQLVGDYVPRREEGTSFPVPQIIVELLVTSEDRAAAESAMKGGNRVLRVAPGGPEIFENLGLNEDAESVLSLVDGQRSASEIAASTVLDAFSVYKLLHAFETVGVVESGDTDAALTMAPIDDDLDWGTPEPPAPHQAHEPPLGPATSVLSSEAIETYDPAPDTFEGEGEALASAEPEERFVEPVVDRPEPFRRRVPEKKKGSRVILLLSLAIVLLCGAAAAWWFFGAPAASAPNARDPQADEVVVEPVTALTPELPAPVVTETVEPVSTSTAADTVDPAVSGDPAPPVSEVAWSWQVAFVCQESSLAGARTAGGTEVWTMPVERDGRTCHRVLWGRFDSRDAAREARSQLPAYFGETPIIVSPRTMGR